MATFEEKVYVSEFNVLPSKSIGVRKTTEVLKDGASISQTYWRCVLTPHDPQAQAVLGDEPYYYNLAVEAWKDVPLPPPRPVEEKSEAEAA
jgi:hypothetical protein